MLDVLRDVLQSDLVIGHFVYGTGVTNGGLDADTIDRVLDDVVVKRNGVDDIRRTTTNRSNRKTVPTRTESVLERDSLIHCKQCLQRCAKKGLRFRS
jgi:hypothetical protein